MLNICIIIIYFYRTYKSLKAVDASVGEERERVVGLVAGHGDIDRQDQGSSQDKLTLYLPRVGVRVTNIIIT